MMNDDRPEFFPAFHENWIGLSKQGRLCIMSPKWRGQNAQSCCVNHFWTDPLSWSIFLLVKERKRTRADSCLNVKRLVISLAHAMWITTTSN